MEERIAQFPLAKISPSILASDLSCIADECRKMTAAGCDWIHFDVMDGHFVNNLTLGAPLIQCARNHVEVFFDCHLMVSHPLKWVKSFKQAGCDMFTFHIESEDDPQEVILSVKSEGMKVGVALKPSTPLQSVLPFVKEIDFVLVMTVEPGFGGQKFLPQTMDKVQTLRTLCPSLDIGVDGGLSRETIDLAARAGSNVIIAGTSIFKDPVPAEMISHLRERILFHRPNWLFGSE